jgi:hypothetical protein
VQVVEWTGIVAYVAKKAPALVSSFQGVPQRDIVLCEQRYGVKLPASSVEFLLRMGEESGTLEPLGSTQSHRFSDLMAPFPPVGYPAKRLFKVSFETDETALVQFDKFLDMSEADEHDARLVEFEPGAAATSVKPGDLTFGESVVLEIFTGLEVYKTKYAATISLQSESEPHGLESKAAVVDLLLRLGFELVMPDLPRVACLNRDAISVMVTVYRSLQSVTISLGGGTVLGLEELVADLTANLQGADVLHPPFEQVE